MPHDTYQRNIFHCHMRAHTPLCTASQLHSCEAPGNQDSTCSRTPPPNQPQPCKDHLSKEETARINLLLFARRGDISFWHCTSPLDPVLDQSCWEGKHQHTLHLSSYLWDLPRSRDQPSRGPAVALVPPLLNSVSDMSSGLKVVDWLLLSLV